jgi:hypothetical protein
VLEVLELLGVGAGDRSDRFGGSTIQRGFKMKQHWYTTVFGFLAAAPQFLQMFGIGHFGHLGGATIDQVIAAVGVAGLGAVAADANKAAQK